MEVYSRSNSTWWIIPQTGESTPNQHRGTSHRGGTQRFTNAVAKQHETSFISLFKQTKRGDHGVSLSTGTEQLYYNNIWVADTGASCHTTNCDSGSVLTKNASARMMSLKPSLDASGNEMRTKKLIDVTNSILNSRTQKKRILRKASPKETTKKERSYS